MKTIFYIHDQQGEVQERRRLLEASGFGVHLVSDGRSALAEVQRERPELVLLDTLLDGPNGFEICRRLRALEHLESTPILLLAGIYRGPAYREAAMLAGADAFLEGPVALPDLIAEITRAIELGEREFTLRS
ncbi:MAG: response regulator [Planctomycetes bacterium]|nr:response regulator [Planctomycetota bacterium]